MIDVRRCQRAEDRIGESTAYGNLGNAYGSLGQYDKAIEFLTKYLSICRELGDRAGEGGALGNLGAVFYCLCQYDKAVERSRPSISTFPVSWGTGLGKAPH